MSPFKELKYPRWRPRWPHIYKSVNIPIRKMVLVARHSFLGSRNPILKWYKGFSYIHIIYLLYIFGVTCCFDEVLRFKRSAVAAAAKATDLSGISNANNGLVQVLADNVDVEVYSQNGLRSTYVLVLLLTQNSEVTDDSNEKQTIRRLKKTRDELLNYIRYSCALLHWSPKNCHVWIGRKAMCYPTEHSGSAYYTFT